MINRNEILLTLRTNKDLMKKKFGVEKIALFGSYARGDETPSSDIDLLIEVMQQNYKNRFLLREFLEKKFNKKVTIGYKESLKPFVREKVEEELIYS